MRMMIPAIAATLVLAACSKGKEYSAGGEADTVRDTSGIHVRIPDINVGMKTDTFSVPTIGIQKDTIVIDRPVITGRKPVGVKRPTVDVQKKP